MKYLIAAILSTIGFGLCVYGLIVTGSTNYIAPAVFCALVMTLSGKESVDNLDKAICGGQDNHLDSYFGELKKLDDAHDYYSETRDAVLKIMNEGGNPSSELKDEDRARFNAYKKAHKDFNKATGEIK